MSRARWRARTVLDKSVPVELGDARRLMVFGRRAAVPARAVMEKTGERWLEVRAPGATARSTEVRWDAAGERLLVGVWCGKPPERLALPLTFPLPELAWFASFHLPGFAGQLARVSVERGVISMRVPHLGTTPLVLAGTRDKDRLATHDDDSGPPPVPATTPALLDMQAA